MEEEHLDTPPPLLPLDHAVAECNDIITNHTVAAVFARDQCPRDGVPGPPSPEESRLLRQQASYGDLAVPDSFKISYSLRAYRSDIRTTTLVVADSLGTFPFFRTITAPSAEAITHLVNHFRSRHEKALIDAKDLVSVALWFVQATNGLPEISWPLLRGGNTDTPPPPSPPSPPPPPPPAEPGSELARQQFEVQQQKLRAEEKEFEQAHCWVYQYYHHPDSNPKSAYYHPERSYDPVYHPREPGITIIRVHYSRSDQNILFPDLRLIHAHKDHDGHLFIQPYFGTLVTEEGYYGYRLVITYPPPDKSLDILRDLIYAFQSRYPDVWLHDGSLPDYFDWYTYHLPESLSDREVRERERLHNLELAQQGLA